MKYLAYRLRSMLALLLLCSALCAFTASISAQEPYNDPATSAEEKIDRKTGQLKQKQSPSLADQMQLLARRAVVLMRSLQEQVFLYFNEWAETLGRWLFVLILLISFLRLWRESGARSMESLGWWFGRVAICIGLLGAGPLIIDGLYGIGKDIAEGSSGNSVLARFYYKNQANFTESYSKIAMGTFTVKLNRSDKEGVKITPVEGGDSFLGVLRDQSSTIRDFNNVLKDSSKTMPMLFAWLGGCRAFLELGDFLLAVLGGVLLLIFKILAPFMVAFAVDRDFARKFTLPAIYGLGILTLIWPAVSYFIRGMAYLVGNVAMSLGDGDPVFAWNAATMQNFRSVQAQPLYTIIFACFTMTISAICLWASPVIASYIAAGRVYEGVSSAVSSASGTIVGAAVEWYTSSAAAKLSQEATTMQANAGFESETTRAGGERQAADIAARSRQVASTGQITGDAHSQLRQVYASRDGQVLLAKAQEGFNNSSTNEQARLAKFNNWTGADRDLRELNIGTAQQTGNNLANNAAEIWNSSAGLVNQAGSLGGPVTKGVGAGVGYGMHVYGSQVRLDGQQEALLKASSGRADNINETADKSARNQDNYVDAMKPVYKDLAAGQINAANVSASEAAGGINRGAAIKLDAVNRSTEMELEANKIRNESQVEAAGITRQGSIDAARLHAMERVLSSVGSKIARDIEKSMEMRF